jgi:hypothetical protein
MRTLALVILLLASPAFAQPAQPPASVNEFFASMKGEFNSAAAEPDHRPLFAVVLALCAASLGVVAVRQWNRRSTPKPGARAPVKNQKKLLSEAARLAGVSKSQMRQIESLTRAEGLSSPLVAIICPSVLKKLASSADTDHEKHAIAHLARQMARK